MKSFSPLGVAQLLFSIENATQKTANINVKNFRKNSKYQYKKTFQFTKKVNDEK
jgi:hypothetical protein